MKRFIISALFVFGFGSYALYNHAAARQQDDVTAASMVALPSPTDSPTPTKDRFVAQTAPPPTQPVKAPPAPIPTPAPVPAPLPKPVSGKYVDGVYTGTAANAYYGYVQVRATVTGGKLTNIAFLRYPNDRQTSLYINQQALPMLRTEAIQAQSANVDGVSGASDTSQAFVESLGSALAQAKA